jgi:hypothetical protein
MLHYQTWAPGCVGARSGVWLQWAVIGRCTDPYSPTQKASLITMIRERMIIGPALAHFHISFDVESGADEADRLVEI